MNCLESKQCLQRQLDGEPFDGAGLEEHLVRCAACRALHAAARQLKEGLRRLPAPAVPAGLRDRTVALLLADQRARRRRRRLLAGLAAAAALLLAVQVGHYWLRLVGPPARRPAPPLERLAGSPAQRPAPPEVPELVPPPAPLLRDSVAEAGSAVVRLTRRKADETVSQTRWLWPTVTPPPLDDPDILSGPLEPPARSLREAGQNVSAGLEPVATSARRAVGMFLREVPPTTADDRPGF
ncbi:MAG TPA: hypothetical protein VNK04_08875 [Gemmataceae bacterium]|nr:hypothetical protein [Gemmataceae bacterium]